MSITRVNAAYGMSETFWDIHFTAAQAAYADLSDTDHRFISVTVDPESGKVALNPGYEPGSPQHDDETALFSNFEDAIVEELAREVRNEDPAYSAFLQKAAEDAENRRGRLQDLEFFMI